ncbi:MAG: hypothetical protein Q8Q25_00855 [bacterium]|nr:hypothetical protein [bacterium]
MITHKKCLVFFITASLTPVIRADFFDLDMNNFWDKQTQLLEEMRDTMQKTRETLQSNFNANLVSLNITEDEKNNVVITLNGITTDNFNASISSENDMLTVSTPTENIKVFVDHLSRNREFVSVKIVQETRQENKDINDKNKEEQTQAFYHSSCVRSGHTIEGSINLESILDNPTQAITYNKKTKTLTILLPKTDVKKTNYVIPVFVVNEDEHSEK